ncbi:MAG: RagB/SusD family nutrient uptake outer membrane protein [Tidjanibacter sp.]|nr:RagB/SusD family nutrient uptake outer membrane protein [Tidjanibacter sp.]
MKKIFQFVAVALATLSISSCDLEKLPYTAIEQEVAFQSVQDLANYRVGFYSPLKQLTVGGRLYYEDIRGDMFHALADFGNFVGLPYAWIMESTDQDAEGLWFGDYSYISNMNYALDAFPKFLEDYAETLDEDDVKLVNQYIAEAHMTRAIAYLDLVTKFCKAYNPATAETDLGLMITEHYAPTSDNTKYPGRSSLKATYDFIMEDIKAAEAGITAAGAPNSVYYTVDAVKALKARVALYMQDYQTASTLAHSLIDGGKYALAEGDNFVDMWVNDASTENIMLVTMSLQDAGAATGTYFIYDNDKGDGTTPDPQYMPTQALLDLYGEGDIRFEAYFAERYVETEVFGEDDLWLFYKYTGNPALRTGAKWNYVQMGKPFRIAEQYLIAAEADAQLGGNYVANGAAALNTLRAARIANYTEENYMTDAQLLAAVKTERARELVGEGFRMQDLKRWGQNVTRGASQSPSTQMMKTGANYGEMTNKDINSPGALWPIPKTEIDANPQIRGQQNPGY